MSKQSNLAEKNVHIDEIINGCLNGDSNAQRLLFKKFASKMLGICMRYCRNNDVAKDAMQEGFVKVFNNLAGFKKDSAIETWMTRIMINAALNELRRNRKYDFIDDIDGMNESVEQSVDVNADAVSKMSHEELIQLLQTIPDGYRVVFNMYAIEGYSHKEIAETLKISEGTSKSQLNRARLHLKNLVESKLGIYSV